MSPKKAKRSKGNPAHHTVADLYVLRHPSAIRSMQIHRAGTPSLGKELFFHNLLSVGAGIANPEVPSMQNQVVVGACMPTV